MRFHLAVFSVALTIPLATVRSGAPLIFNEFVSGSSINAVEGQNETIGFAYAGNKFVGSVYLTGRTTISCTPLI